MSARNQHLGAVGDRLQLLASVVYVKVLRNEWSYTYLVILHDDEGHSLKTFYSGHKWLPERGQRVEVTATIKAHEEYKGEAVTELSRAGVKVLGLAAGFKEFTRAPLPRVEELRWEQAKKAQRDFYAAGVSRAR